MDLLTRLIAGSGSSPTKQRTNTPAERLATCKSICNAIHQQWRNGGVEREEEQALIYTTKLLNRLDNILEDESRRAAPHSCLRHVASSQIYIVVTKLAVSCRDIQIIRAAAELFHVLINGEAEGLLDSRLFTRSLLDLACYATIGGSVIVEEKLQTDLVELLFEVATKIRADPDILPAWFYPDREPGRGRNAVEETRRSQFPLFYVLVQYVHHDGSVGDFSRTALLYLTETASKFKPLENWMLESDLAPQMASGLGALYSRLSRQSRSLTRAGNAPPIMALSDNSETPASLAESPPDSEQDLKAFFSYLAFWQDTLNHCKSIEVTDTLLDHFQVLFVQQLLYPSLLESSDVEGGSTAAVITHLYRLLLALDHHALVDRILRYLLASPNMPPMPRDKAQRRQRMSVSRRKSIDHLKALSEVADSPSPNLFSLLDLIVMSLKSSHPETVNACLKLLSAIIEKHHSHVVQGLFRLEPMSTAAEARGVKQFNSRLIKMFDYAAVVMDSPDDMDQSYQAALADSQILLEQHSCFISSHVNVEDFDLKEVSIARDCKLFESLLSLLRNFFANDTVTNLYLTEVIMSLAACDHMSVRGWLLPSNQPRPSDNESLPDSVASVIGELVEQIRQWKVRFAEWDDMITSRKAELSAEEQPQQPKLARNLSISDQTRSSSTRPRDASPSGTNSSTHSRPSTPRGRAIPRAEFGSIDSAFSPGSGHRSSFLERTLGTSPLRQSYLPGTFPIAPEPDLGTSRASSAAPWADMLRTKIKLTTSSDGPPSLSQPAGGGAGKTSVADSPALKADTSRLMIDAQAVDSGSVTPLMQENGVREEVSLSHILTNAVILQEFILEIAAMVQLRATFFGEVDMP